MNSLFKQHSFALLTDFYEITMAYAYWKNKMMDVEAVFHLFFRRKPFNGGYGIVAGLESVIDYLKNYRFDASDIAYLATLEGADNQPLFEEAFLDYLLNLKFTCDLDAMAEGEVVFPYEPLIRIQGPIIQCQLLESPLLTLTNFPTLIATKAARICIAAKGDPVMEFGLRRAQGIDGAITATRSAYIGGCAATSNVFSGKALGIPLKGTHAHSWVMAFESEYDSFQAYAEALPGNCVFLVDTYDTIDGVKNAIEIGKWLKKRGRSLLGIRLDSGDLTYLSIESRKLLDEAGFKETQILASNELDELIIADLKNQGAQIAAWGVGTHLVTGHMQPALDGVYKLSALRKLGKAWEYKIKLSEQMTKMSNPGILQTRRYYNEKGYIADCIYDCLAEVNKVSILVDPFDATRQRRMGKDLKYRDLLVPIFRSGECVYPLPTLNSIQDKAKSELNLFDRSIKRFINPHTFPVGLELSLYEKKIDLVHKIRRKREASTDK